MCLAQGHNVVTPMRHEPAALRSRVKYSTTEPLPSLQKGLNKTKLKNHTAAKMFQMGVLWLSGNKWRKYFKHIDVKHMFSQLQETLC